MNLILTVFYVLVPNNLDINNLEFSSKNWIKLMIT